MFLQGGREKTNPISEPVLKSSALVEHNQKFSQDSPSDRIRDSVFSRVRMEGGREKNERNIVVYMIKNQCASSSNRNVIQCEP